MTLRPTFTRFRGQRVLDVCGMGKSGEWLFAKTFNANSLFLNCACIELEHMASEIGLD